MRLIFCLLLTLTFAFAKMPDWKMERFLELQKDEFYRVGFTINNEQKTLSLRWTLHKNEGLVMHLNYDRFPHQFILYRDYKRACYKVELFKPQQGFVVYYEAPYAMVCFKDYDRLRKVASLKFYIFGGERDFKLTEETQIKNQQGLQSDGFEGR